MNFKQTIVTILISLTLLSPIKSNIYTTSQTPDIIKENYQQQASINNTLNEETVISK